MNIKKRILQGLLAGSTFAVLIAPGPGWAQGAGDVVCAVTGGFHDGDTFACTGPDQTYKVRVAGIDAPETGQAFWRVSRDLLRTRAVAGTVAGCYKADRFRRQICRVTAPDGTDVALELVRTGLAWHTVKYRREQTPEEQDQYAAAEAQARARGLGLWSQPDPQEPGDCRASKKQRVACR